MFLGAARRTQGAKRPEAGAHQTAERCLSCLVAAGDRAVLRPEFQARVRRVLRVRFDPLAQPQPVHAIRANRSAVRTAGHAVAKARPAGGLKGPAAFALGIKQAGKSLQSEQRLDAPEDAPPRPASR